MVMFMGLMGVVGDVARLRMRVVAITEEDVVEEDVVVVEEDVVEEVVAGGGAS